jgi:hypothetical protein
MITTRQINPSPFLADKLTHFVQLLRNAFVILPMCNKLNNALAIFRATSLGAHNG